MSLRLHNDSAWFGTSFTDARDAMRRAARRVARCRVRRAARKGTSLLEMIAVVTLLGIVVALVHARAAGRVPTPAELRTVNALTTAAMVVAVKPQVAPDIVPKLAGYVGAKTVVVSIMAGKTMAFLETALPKAAIVRTMPNTPAAIGRGITVAVGNRGVTASGRKLAHALLAASGSVEWVDDEALMDAVTLRERAKP